MAYDLYPAVDENYDFPPEIRAQLARSQELRNQVIPMTTSVRNNLTGPDLWDGRLIMNTTTDRVNRYDQGTTSWVVLAEMPEVTAAVVLGTPVGAIVAYASNVAPSGWHLCDGTAHSSAELQAKLTLGGHPNPHLTPNLKDKFILGDGGTLPNSGGASTVLLSAAQSGLPAHIHAGTTAAETAEHTHGIDPPSTRSGNDTVNHSHYVEVGGGDHNHISSYASQHLQNMDAAGSGYDAMIMSASWITGGGHGHAAQSGTVSDWHQHDVDIPYFNSYGRSAAHTHTFTAPANTIAAASAAHENMPPYYALTYIIKTV